MTAALAGRVALQALTFVLVARALGADEFGQFASALAVATIVMPFAAMGMGNVLVMRASRRPAALGQYVGASVVTLAVTVPVLTAIVLAGGTTLLPGVPVTVFLGVCLSELLLVRVVEISAQAFQASELMSWMAALVFGAMLARAAAAGLLTVVTPSASASEWAGWYTAAALVAAVASVIAVRRRLRPTGAVGRPSTTDLREGLYFALGFSANGAFTDADKALVARLDSFDAAGAYTAGYRVVSFSFVPILAMLQSTYASFFRAGAKGVRSSWRYSKRLFPAAAAYSVAAGLALLLLAPFVPEILGSDYEPAVRTVRILAALPLLQTLMYLAGDALTGAGHQRERALLLWVGAAVGVVGAFALIPPFGATGAAISTLIAAVFMVFALWLLVAFRIRREVDA
jgi:O-antigen/teichoic acid export membrane protein